MGMFTTIIDPVTKKSYQIKSGYDFCETYFVGDKVNQWINPNTPNSGMLLDGVYCSTNVDDEFDVYIIIKDSYVIAIENWNREEEDDPYLVFGNKYQIKELPRETWSEEVWERYETLKAKVKKENDEFLASIARLSAEERFAQIIAQPIKKMINYSSIARQVFSVEPMKINKINT